METVITQEGQAVIPKYLREKYKIRPGMKVQWIDTGSVIKLIPIPDDPIGALRGCASGEDLTLSLLKSRSEDKARE